MPSASLASAEQMVVAAIRTKHLKGEMGVSGEEALDRLLVDQERWEDLCKRKRVSRGTLFPKKAGWQFISKELTERPGGGVTWKDKALGPPLTPTPPPDSCRE